MRDIFVFRLQEGENLPLFLDFGFSLGHFGNGPLVFLTAYV